MNADRFDARLQIGQRVRRVVEFTRIGREHTHPLFELVGRQDVVRATSG